MGLIDEPLTGSESLHDHRLVPLDFGLEFLVLLVQGLRLVQILAHHGGRRLRQVIIDPLQLGVQLEAELVEPHALLQGLATSLCRLLETLKSARPNTTSNL